VVLWGSGVARPQPEESDGGGATDHVEKIDVLGFFLGADGFCSNVVCLVVAVDKTIALGEPMGAHPSILAPHGLVFGSFLDRCLHQSSPSFILNLLTMLVLKTLLSASSSPPPLRFLPLLLSPLLLLLLSFFCWGEDYFFFFLGIARGEYKGEVD
jgi:hypothetical protein